MAPFITVLGSDGEIYLIPAQRYPAATPRETEEFWIDLEENLHQTQYGFHN